MAKPGVVKIISVDSFNYGLNPVNPRLIILGLMLQQANIWFIFAV
jgi:hypothetical protein